MRSRLKPDLVLALALALGLACDWDLSQSFVHPSVEDRVRASLAGDFGTPVPPSVNPDSFRFALFGDPQVKSDGVHRLDRFREDVAARDIDFFCVLGDLTHDATAAEVELIKAALDSIGIPYYATAGNHDLYQADGWQLFTDNFGPSCYAITIGDVLKLILLDTASGTIGPTQFDWLEAELGGPGPHAKVVGTHFPCYDGITPNLYRMAGAAERYKLQYLLREHGAYAFVSGHIHGWRHTVAGDVHHFIAGSMASGGLDYGVPGYLLLTCVRGNLSWEFVRL